MTNHVNVPENELGTYVGGKKGSRTVYWIDIKKCISCGLCEESCPAKAISKFDGFHMAVSHAMCAGCGVCASICPKEAVGTMEI